MRTLTRLFLAASCLTLAGCGASRDAGNLTPPIEGKKKFTWKSNQGPLEIDYSYDSFSGSYKLGIKRPGRPFTTSDADDIFAQNSVRDAFNASGICPTGTFAGIISVGYGRREDGDWSAYVRCTTTKQQNIDSFK